MRRNSNRKEAMRQIFRALTNFDSFPVGWFVTVVATSSALAIYLAAAGAPLALAMAPVVIGTGVMGVLGYQLGKKRRGEALTPERR